MLSVVIITLNEEANIGRTLRSIESLVKDGRGEIIVVDSGSTDRTCEIARSFGAQVFVEPWKGYAAQKNSGLSKARGEWILSLDADEELEPRGGAEIGEVMQTNSAINTASPVGYFISRKNYFLGRWMKHGGFWPDPKPRLFRHGVGRFEDRKVHEDVRINGTTGKISTGALIHHSYPALSDYIEHMNRYSSLGAEMVGARSFSVMNIVLRPMATFVYNYFFRLGFLDGREGLLLHLYHAVYVSWKYAKAWESGRSAKSAS
jgi:glycosyltransferase involved in cell wall biosynthesis